jgi:hypothetical protein
MRLPVAGSCGIAGEKPRYSPFVTALNEMLLHSRKLKSRDDTINDRDIIFAVNSPAAIESYHLAKRKPPLVCLLAEKFKSSFDKHSPPGFKACMSNARKLKGDNKKFDPKEVSTTTWGDILQSWELEAKGKINSEMRTDFKTEDFLDADEEDSSTNVPAGGSTSQCKCASVPQTLLMLLQFMFLKLAVSNAKEVQQVFLHRRKSKPMSRFPLLPQ